MPPPVRLVGERRLRTRFCTSPSSSTQRSGPAAPSSASSSLQNCGNELKQVVAVCRLSSELLLQHSMHSLNFCESRTPPGARASRTQVDLANQFWLSAGWGRAWQRGRRRRERRHAPSLFPFGVLVAAAVGASLVARGAILVPCSGPRICTCT